ncbi:MAG: CBASS cGAMP synthase [Phycisphaerales bacterium]|nr:CBASS cGAMP synthase [Phycisphaerales bacterium]
MANCTDLFLNYNNLIKLTNDKRNILLQTRESLRKRMLGKYKKISVNEQTSLLLEFQSQGSFVMDTIITPVNEDFDLDDGVYFIGSRNETQKPSPAHFHKWVMQAVDNDNDYEEVVDKDTCVRIKYKQGFHIDLPIYYASKFEHPELAHKKDGWLESNPVEFIAWFEDKAKSGFNKAFLYESRLYSSQFDSWLNEQRKADCQLRRIVRYIKAWADLKRDEMPCGIEITILVANNYAENLLREDLALRDTLINIKSYLLNNGFKCPRPTTPINEDLFQHKTEQQKKYFLTAVNGLIASANNALEADNQKDSCKEWEKHFGSRFPCHLANNYKETPKRDIAALQPIAATSKPYGF